jgi:hypothetical protein
MSKKLIPIDAETGRYLQVDVKRLIRETHELINFIDANIKPHNDKFEIIKYVRPLCLSVLTGSLKLPLDSSELPLKYYTREGMLPNDFDIVYSSFALTISGIPRTMSAPETIYVNGNPYEYVEFED